MYLQLRRPACGLSLLVVLVGITAVSSPQAVAGSGSAGDADCEPGVPVRAKITLTNTSGQTANDLHFYMYQNDRPEVVVTGATASTSGFANVGMGLDSHNGKDIPPGVGPPYHGAQVDMSGGSIPPGGPVQIEVVLCMNERNCIKIKDIEWTHDGDPIGGQPDKPDGGWRAREPFGGGNGGNPGDPGGGGQGAQEGGGGAGNSVHIFCIENDSTTNCMQVNELKLLASMTYYADLDTIDWASIDPIRDVLGRPPVLIPPGGKWCYEFQTTGDYIGGHVYSQYDATAVSCPPGLPPAFAPLQGVEGEGEDGSVITVGDHPNPDPSGDGDLDGLPDAWEENYGLDPSDDGSGNPDNGPAGDPDGDGVTNEEELAALTDPQDPGDPFTIPPGPMLFRAANFGQWFIGLGVSDPLPAGFFGPGSDPFESTILTFPGGLATQPCPPIDLPADIIINRLDTLVLNGLGGDDTIQVELNAMNLVSVASVEVAFNGGESSKFFDVFIDVTPTAPNMGTLQATRTQFGGGQFQLSFQDAGVSLTFVEDGNPTNVFVADRIVDIFVPPSVFQTLAPPIDCPECMDGFYAGTFFGGFPGSIQFSGSEFLVDGQIPCPPTPTMSGDIFGGGEFLDAVGPNTITFGHGFPEIPANFFNPGSLPFEGTIPLNGADGADYVFCPPPLFGTDTIIDRYGPGHLPNAGSQDAIPIELVSLSLVSTAPITVNTGGGDDTFNVTVGLSNVVPSTGQRDMTRTCPLGGLFNDQFLVVPRITFTNTNNPSHVCVLDYGALGQGFPLIVENNIPQPFAEDSSPLNWNSCSSNFVPGLDPSCFIPYGPVVPPATEYVLRGGPLVLTLAPTDMTPDSDNDGLTDFQEGGLGTDANDSDSDNDGVSDGDEVQVFGSDPNDIDTDNDGFTDGEEINGNGDATDPAVIPTTIAWVDFAYAGTEFGSNPQPYNTFGEAIAILTPTGTIRIKGNTADSTTAETPRITKAMRIEAFNGSVRIGAP